MQYFGFDRPSFAFKTFGFGESDPKLQADFTTGTYKASGVTKMFADLFTFNRAGKAWLVKETGLQEYAVDVPRLDDGLLIEQSATNYYPNNTSLTSSEWTYRGTGIPDDNGFFRFLTGPGLVNSTPVSAITTVQASLSIVIERPTAPVTLRTVRAGGGYSGISINPDFTVQATNLTPNPLPTAVGAVVVGDIAQVGLSRPFVEGLDTVTTSCIAVASAADFKVKLPQWEIGDNFTSSIPTTTTPVTRPADYLLNNITGTTVTGDWDSTLNLSIVNGNLVHSGYGRIRSLEIN